MAKKPFPFAGKEGKKEEKMEKKSSKSAYARGEKKEAAMPAFLNKGKKKGC